MPKYAKAISAMSVEFGKSTEDLNAALYQILSAQVPPSMALDVLREGAKGAIGGLSSVNDSVYNLITLLQNYGGQLKDAADAEDWMFAVLRRGRFEGGYTDLVTNLGKVVPDRSGRARQHQRPGRRAGAHHARRPGRRAGDHGHSLLHPGVPA